MATTSSSAIASPDRTTCTSLAPARQRDVLFGAGCGLLCFGLFPFSAPPSRDALGSNTEPFNARTCVLSITLACLGLACLLLACLELPRAKLRAALLVVLAPLAAVVVVSGATILQMAHANDVVSVLRHSHVLSFDQELRMELAVNDLYCNAVTHELCQRREGDSVAMTLGIPSHSQACGRARAAAANVPFDLDPLTLIIQPTDEMVHWCGQYVATPNHDDALDLTQSPYQQHHAEVIDSLLAIRSQRLSSSKLLMVLEWFAIAALVAVVWWLRDLSFKVPTLVHSIV